MSYSLISGRHEFLENATHQRLYSMNNLFCSSQLLYWAGEVAQVVKHLTSKSKTCVQAPVQQQQRNATLV
jgi:hypothetical protein